MAKPAGSANIKGLVFEAVDAANLKGTVSRTAVVSTFAKSGPSRATLYRWIDERITDLAAERVSEPPTIRADTTRRTDHTEQVLMRAPVVLADAAIPFLADIQDSLKRLRILLAMAEGEPGKIRNVKLTLAAIEMLGRTLARAADIQERIADHDSQISFLRSMAEVVLEEVPDVRDRIIAKMKSRNAGYGIL